MTVDEARRTRKAKIVMVNTAAGALRISRAKYSLGWYGLASRGVPAPSPPTTQEDDVHRSVVPTILGVTASLAILGGMAFAAQDRSALKVPGGLSFSEFKGYETWQVVAPSQTKESIKSIAANDVMMRAYRAGLPAKGKTFPEGSKIVKIEWALKQNTVSPYFVNVPGALKSIAFIVKDTRRFPKSHGWAYAQFLYDPATRTLKPGAGGNQCGYACHTTVAAQDYIFTAYPER